MKNIPLIKEKDFKPLFLDSISKFMTNLEWKANVFLNPEKFRNKKESFGKAFHYLPPRAFQYQF